MRTRSLGIWLLALLAFGMAWGESGRGLNRKLYAVPRPGPVTIDGKLDDWDFTAAIESYEQYETRATQRGECAVMYDDDAFYLGARVKDTSPMRNRHNPAADADKAWMGDCMQFRLVTDRRLPFPYRRGSLGGGVSTGAESGQPIHLTIWYYTDNKEPALQVFKTMGLLPVREAWGPHGVVPHTHYQAAYHMDEDGKGFSYEYRIPWDTLNAKDCHPVAGDVITATAQFLWGDATGLVYKGCAYDLMSSPGFPWQDSGCWGKLIFTDRNNIPRSWVDPFRKPAPPTPLTFSYTQPADAETSIALYDKENRLVRHIVAQAPRKAGPVTEAWDGRDSSGKPLPAGDYTWKGLYHPPFTTRYVMSIANSGKPAWKTADGTGGWGGDYGPPTCAAVAGNRMILGWTGHEAGWGIIATDLTGKKLWGLGHKNASVLASDGTRFFANGEAEGKDVNVYAVTTGQPMVFGNGRQALQPPAGGTVDSNVPTGLACNRGALYVSFGRRDLVGVYDSTSGDLTTTWAIAKPGCLAPAADGSVLVVSAGAVVRVADGKAAPFLTAHLDAPTGIAVDAKGTIYVANRGALQNVSVFSPAGRFRHSIGLKGGRPVPGAFNPAGMRDPGSIAVDGDGKLWVPETALNTKRLSVWSTKTRKLAKEFFGGCSYSPFVWIDPANPKEAFFDNTIWRIDLEKGTWYPKSIFYAMKNGNAVNPGNGGFFFPFRAFTAKNGRQYAVSMTWAFGPIFWMRVGDRFKPLYYRFRHHPNPVLCPRGPFDFMNAKGAKFVPGRDYLWTDANDDEVAQEAEVREVPATPSFTWMDADLNLYGDGVVYSPTAVSKSGVPSYDFTKPRRISKDNMHTIWTDEAGTQLWSWVDGSHLAKYRADGTREWSYPGLLNWRDAINQGAPPPGTLWGATCPTGVVGRYSGLVSYFGTMDLVRDDGLFVAQVFEHGSKGNNGPHIFYVEFLAGQMVSPKGTGKTYLLGGDQDCRVTELIGLDTVRDLPGGTYHHTPELVAQAAQAFAAYQASIASGQPLVLARGGAPGLACADPVGKSVDDKHAFQVQAAYDETNVYFRYSVVSPAPLINGIVDAQTIFHGGNLLDIQVGADPAADAKRTTPAPGDARLLISMRDGKPWAVVLRPKVAGFAGQPITLTSPTGFEKFDVIAATDRVELRGYAKTGNGFTVTAVVPRDLLGLDGIKAGDTRRMDVGYIFGNAGGTQAGVRAYWHNNSFTANVVNDIPHESRLEPAQWGTARVE
jgi:hypothetical protein